MKRDSKPAGWAEAGLLISGYWGKRGNVLSRESPTPPRLQLNPGLLATSASLPGGRGRAGRSREGRGYSTLPGSSANEIPSISLARSAVQSHLRTCGSAQ